MCGKVSAFSLFLQKIGLNVVEKGEFGHYMGEIWYLGVKFRGETEYIGVKIGCFVVTERSKTSNFSDKKGEIEQKPIFRIPVGQSACPKKYAKICISQKFFVPLQHNYHGQVCPSGKKCKI